MKKRFLICVISLLLSLGFAKIGHAQFKYETGDVAASFIKYDEGFGKTSLIFIKDSFMEVTYQNDGQKVTIERFFYFVSSPNYSFGDTIELLLSNDTVFYTGRTWNPAIPEFKRYVQTPIYQFNMTPKDTFRSKLSYEIIAGERGQDFYAIDKTPIYYDYQKVHFIGENSVQNFRFSEIRLIDGIGFNTGILPFYNIPPPGLDRKNETELQEGLAYICSDTSKYINYEALLSAGPYQDSLLFYSNCSSNYLLDDLKAQNKAVSVPAGKNLFAIKVINVVGKNRLKIIDSQNEHYAISIYNLNGKCILSENHSISVKKIDLNHCPAGIYILKIKTSHGVQTHKIRVY